MDNIGVKLLFTCLTISVLAIMVKTTEVGIEIPGSQWGEQTCTPKGSVFISFGVNKGRAGRGGC